MSGLFASYVAAALLAGAVIAAVHLSSRKRRTLIKTETSRIRLVARRNLCTAIIVAPSVEQAPVSRSLEPWLSGLGFAVTRVEDLALLAQAVDFTPTVTAVDAAMSGKMVSSIDSHFRAKLLNPSATVIFYNAGVKIRAERRGYLKCVHFLGDTFTRPEVVRILAPLILVETVTEEPSKMTIEGELGEQATRDILEYLETGSKSGVLTIRDPDYRVVGVVGMENGSIIHARTGRTQGEPAVMEMLAASKGFFQFHAGRPGLTPHCAIAPQHLLLKWAQEIDEVGRDAAVSQTPLVFGS